MNSLIRSVALEDVRSLASIHAESWKAAFTGIIPAERMEINTDRKRIEKMYESVIAENRAIGYLSEEDREVQGFAFWSEGREEGMQGMAELICIHILPEYWHQGIGSRMMEKILWDMQKAGYEKGMLWVFEANTRAIGLYHRYGFSANGKRKHTRGGTELQYERSLRQSGRCGFGCEEIL